MNETISTTMPELAPRAEIETLVDLEAEDAEREALEHASAEAAAQAARFEAENRKERDREARLADIFDSYHN